MEDPKMPNADTPRALRITSYMADEPVVKKWLALRPQAYAALKPGEFDPILDLIDLHLELWTKVVEAEFPEGKEPNQHCSSERSAGIHWLADIVDATLRETPPATRAGARAIMEYLAAMDEESIPKDSVQYFTTTLLRSPIFSDDWRGREDPILGLIEAHTETQSRAVDLHHKLLETTPTTAVGVRAMIEYLEKFWLAAEDCIDFSPLLRSPIFHLAPRPHLRLVAAAAL
jgi:hypothetical protein